MPFSMDDLPDAEAWTRHLKPTFHVARVVDGASYRVHEASFGPETWMSLASRVFASTPAPAEPLASPETSEEIPEADGDAGGEAGVEEAGGDGGDDTGSH